jgi:YHS domain-containing protein
MKILIIFFSLLYLTTSYGQSDAVCQKEYNIKNGLAIEGYDLVSYFEGKPVEGKSENKFVSKGITYWFVTPANLAKFKTNPGKYVPAYGGWCAYAMGERGEKIKVDPETYKIVEGKLYLFYNFWTNNTLTDWNKNEKKLKEMGDRNWNKIVE